MKQTKDLYDIYQWEDPRDLSVIYIGLTNNLAKRIQQHRGHKDGVLYPWVQELKRVGLEPIVYSIDQVKGLDAARQMEKDRIQERKPLLNIAHNKAAIEEKEYTKFYVETINHLIDRDGFSYREAVLFMDEFNTNQGDMSDYKIIRWTAQFVKQMLGETESFTESEILRIALCYRGKTI